MARSDLLVSLVQAGNTGDRKSFRSVAEAIIAEERAKRHDVLADRLAKVIQRYHQTRRRPWRSLCRVIRGAQGRFQRIPIKPRP